MFSGFLWIISLRVAAPRDDRDEQGSLSTSRLQLHVELHVGPSLLGGFLKTPYGMSPYLSDML